MGWFDRFAVQTSYQAGRRLTGILRYRELTDRYFGAFFKANLLTIFGFLPMGIGFLFVSGTGNPALVLAVFIVGGGIAAPFLAGLYDAVYRALRDAPGSWFENYRKAWRQNWRSSIVPGMVFGLLLGSYSLSGMTLLMSRQSLWTVAVIFFSLILFTMFFSVYWPLLVLMDQTVSVGIQNCLMFLLKEFWKVLGIALLQAAYWIAIVLFFPLSLLTLPILGFWFILFIANFLIYGAMNAVFRIEEQIAAVYPEQAADYRLDGPLP